ncbi:MAG: DUF4292 domain-containing protein, partial [Deltaproteobacteria bacterium]|nr:DUF4292 domain-containing protein [Deltaproteobacteria bacterium]
CSCAVPPPVPPPEAVTAAEVLGEWRQRQAAVFSLRGEARVGYREEEGKTLNSRQVLLVRQPDRLRLELLGLFGSPVLVAALNNREAAALDLSQGAFFRGAPSAANLDRLLRLPVSSRDLVALALHQTPPLEDGIWLAAATADGYRLSGSGDDEVQELHFSRDRQLVRLILSRRGEKVLEAWYGDFSAEHGGFPLEMKFLLPLRQLEVAIRFTALEVNAPLGDGLFELSPPEGFRVLSLP